MLKRRQIKLDLWHCPRPTRDVRVFSTIVYRVLKVTKLDWSPSTHSLWPVYEQVYILRNCKVAPHLAHISVRYPDVESR